MALEFNPNDMSGPKAPEWATFIPGRKPEFKVHKQRNHALSAFQYRSNFLLFHWEDGKWVEVFRAENWHDDPKKEICDKCGKSTLGEHYGRMYNDGGWVWKRDSMPPVREFIHNQYRGCPK